MKVAIVHSSYQLRGGEDVVVDQEAELLTSAGHSVVRFSRSNNELTEQSQMLQARNTLWNIEYAKVFKEFLRSHEPDIVHVHNTFPLLSPAVISVARELGIPTVQTLHNYRLLCPAGTLLRNGTVCEQCLSKSVKVPAIRFACYRGNRAASAVVAAMLAFHGMIGTYSKKVTRFIALTEFAKSKFIAEGLPADRVMVRHNYLTSDPGMGNGDGRYFLFVGRLAPEKGLEVLLNAWKLLPDPKPELRIAGMGPLEGYVRDLSAHCASIRVLGSLSPQEVIQQMKSAMALVVPSVGYEGFPMTIVEAMAVGTPVIASDLGSMAEIVEPDVSGRLFRVGDSRALSEAVSLFREQWDSGHNMRQSSRHQFELKYSSRVALAQLLSIYEDARASSG